MHKIDRLMSEPSRTNFRQVGTRTGVAVLRGTPVRRKPSPDLQSRVASIPSKYETVLHREANERDAFGIRTQRFNDSETDFPGPGCYYRPSSFVRSTTDSGSVSKLGYSTGFVSKSKRFNDRIKEAVPGPGQYRDTRIERKTLNSKYGSASFASPARDSNQFIPTAVANVPGPSDYNVSQSSSAIAHNIARSAFTSKTTRGFAPRTDVPAPGQYENPLQLGQPRRGNSSPQSVFRSTAKRMEGPDEARLPPGPGAYNAQEAEAALRYDYIARAHTSAVFQRGNVDRFGRVPTKQSSDADIGPGSYNVVLPLTDSGTIVHKSGAAAAFKSVTSRGGELSGGGHGHGGQAAIPGPAFYHPSSPDKRSHILNSNKKWL